MNISIFEHIYNEKQSTMKYLLTSIYQSNQFDLCCLFFEMDLL